jgi:hypothetical protein
MWLSFPHNLSQCGSVILVLSRFFFPRDPVFHRGQVSRKWTHEWAV